MLGFSTPPKKKKYLTQGSEHNLNAKICIGLCILYTFYAQSKKKKKKMPLEYATDHYVNPVTVADLQSADFPRV